MEYSPVFIKARAVAFSLIAFISFAWTVLLTVALTLKWNEMGKPEKSFIGVMIVLNIITMFLLLILLVRKFRPWLDGARCLFILATHLTTAAGFASWVPRFQCPERNGDEEGICELLVVYILIASWVIPALGQSPRRPHYVQRVTFPSPTPVLTYTGGLVLMVYRRKKLQQASGNTPPGQDVEKRLSEGSVSSSDRSHDSFFGPSKPKSALFDPSKMTRVPPPIQTSERTSVGPSSRSSYSPASSARQSYNTRSSTVPLRISQPMMLGPPRSNHHSFVPVSPTHPSPHRMTWSTPPLTARMSKQGFPPPRPTATRQSSTLSKPSRHDHL
ncbi:hypothetical protein V5O48_008679 [Marasmius crinis-equi]|uniref:Uncharacterized protein n=1 Tax=Marasmius crinis-equi TaxID=585013 RepID=A0ABR3FD85_9AGAR